MKLAVIGSRGFLDYGKLCETLDKVKTPITCIISGGAQGADSLAQEYAARCGLPILIYYPNYKAHPDNPGAACAERNQRIINDCDKVIAFWDYNTPGTRMSLDMAAKAGKQTYIVTFK